MPAAWNERELSSADANFLLTRDFIQITLTSPFREMNPRHMNRRNGLANEL